MSPSAELNFRQVSSWLQAPNLTFLRAGPLWNVPVVTSGESRRGRGKIGVGDKEVQTTMYKINITRIYYTTQGIQPIFDNNYKWSITFKNCESQRCTSETYIILYNYTWNFFWFQKIQSKKKTKKQKKT